MGAEEYLVYPVWRSGWSPSHPHPWGAGGRGVWICTAQRGSGPAEASTSPHIIANHVIHINSARRGHCAHSQIRWRCLALSSGSVGKSPRIQSLIGAAEQSGAEKQVQANQREWNGHDFAVCCGGITWLFIICLSFHYSSLWECANQPTNLSLLFLFFAPLRERDFHHLPPCRGQPQAAAAEGACRHAMPVLAGGSRAPGTHAPMHASMDAACLNACAR